MNLSSRKESGRSEANISDQRFSFPSQSTLVTEEQIKRFELLRLVFFALKLRKLEARPAEPSEDGKAVSGEQERAFRCNLLRHAIFQQVLTLSQLGAREQALQIIETCRK
jgi:hypothetical protein